MSDVGRITGEGVRLMSRKVSFPGINHFTKTQRISKLHTFGYGGQNIPRIIKNYNNCFKNL